MPRIGMEIKIEVVEVGELVEIEKNWSYIGQ